MSRRSRAREVVLQVLYQHDLNPDQDVDIRRQFVNARLNQNQGLVEFAKELLDGVVSHRDEIDERLKSIAANWQLSRMARIDRNILRLGAYEILFAETPDRVAINESIELAKRYGNEQSPQFVNGVLDRLMKRSTGT
jgi:N utilization substance protein B